MEVYRGHIEPEKHFGKYALFVTFFPHLVAGPIIRPSYILPQFQENDNQFSFNNFLIGFSQIMLGMFKKVVVADTLAIYVNSIYNNYKMNTGFTLLFATFAFAIQIYCDFSGYSDIAIGSAKILGYDIKANFLLPYFSKSVTEFWRRLDISGILTPLFQSKLTPMS